MEEELKLKLEEDDFDEDNDNTGDDDDSDDDDDDFWWGVNLSFYFDWFFLCFVLCGLELDLKKKYLFSSLAEVCC